MILTKSNVVDYLKSITNDSAEVGVANDHSNCLLCKTAEYVFTNTTYVYAAAPNEQVQIQRGFGADYEWLEVEPGLTKIADRFDDLSGNDDWTEPVTLSELKAAIPELFDAPQGEV